MAKKISGGGKRNNKSGGGSGDYAVGYGKPPIATRFAPGQSGNPGGRAKGSRGLKTDLGKILSARDAIQIGGKTLKGTNQQLMLATLAARAARGEVKAAALLISTVMEIFGSGDRSDGPKQLSAIDQALLDRLLARLPDELGDAATEDGSEHSGEAEDADPDADDEDDNKEAGDV